MVFDCLICEKTTATFLWKHTAYMHAYMQYIYAICKMIYWVHGSIYIMHKHYTFSDKMKMLNVSWVFICSNKILYIGFTNIINIKIIDTACYNI
jgi:hypothetical protein